MNRIILFILSLLCVLAVLAQDVRKYAGKEFDFNVYIDTGWYNDRINEKTEYYTVDSIVVLRKRTLIPVQIIIPNKDNHTLDIDYPFFVEDMNFDKHEDIRIFQWAGPAYTPFYCWVFNPETKQFESDEELEQIQSPSFDQKKKEITSFWRLGAEELGCTVYKYINGKLTPVRSKP